MKNVYDIRREKNLYFILPKIESVEKTKKRVGIIIYLYYRDMLAFYSKYISNISDDIDVCIVSSIKEVIDFFRAEYTDTNWEYRLKNNSGRDISALYVTCKDFVLDHDYICFVHDKKPHDDDLSEDSKLWNENIWSNCLQSNEYIYSVIGLLDSRDNIGVLSPPEPIGINHSSWWGGGWYDSFSVTKALIEKMKLKCDITPEKPPISLGTAFWFRCDAVKKIFLLDWKYEDFDDSQLVVNENYISYALERVLPYVAQDAGYDTGTIMCREYAEKQTDFIQYAMFRMSSLLGYYSDAITMNDIEDELRRKNYEKQIDVYIRNGNRIYIYGAGNWGTECLHELRKSGIEPSGFIVTKESARNYVDGVAVFEIGKVKFDVEMAVVIAIADKDAQNNIRKDLILRNCNNAVVYGLKNDYEDSRKA